MKMGKFSSRLLWTVSHKVSGAILGMEKTMVAKVIYELT